MHKYRPDKSLGSSWHPWMRNGNKQYPIQEDETATVIFVLWKFYELSKDLEFVEKMYTKLVKKAAEFMTAYRDEKTGLPKASYDLWEQDFGIFTYSAASTYGALKAAARFADLLGKKSVQISNRAGILSVDNRNLSRRAQISGFDSVNRRQLGQSCGRFGAFKGEGQLANGSQRNFIGVDGGVETDIIGENGVH